ncbi:hypothetical protein COO91_09068 [Nostoc flagelliforme CCNUN1]|uniref:Uncharacterized protein n=1 Tax=Nostoc flagelliforme CCNUN1 TaxID=2038116 RepID=A0A2K8T5D2_9NOSO|nr:hypothetical protein [Nostoc flagelliforme]AUB42917.1 hypothetical protein COO91_09068 [Nostoc flagelliforme CCNUN1]
MNTPHTETQLKTADDNNASVVVSIPSSLVNNNQRQVIEPANTKPTWLDVTFNSLITLYSTALLTQLLTAIPLTSPLTSQFVPIAGTLILAVLTVGFILGRKGGLVNLPINVLVVPLSAALGILAGV